MEEVENTESARFCEACTEVIVPDTERICESCKEDYYFDSNGNMQLVGLTEVIPDEPKYLMTVERIGSKGWRIKDMMPGSTFFIRDFGNNIIYWPTKELAVAFLEKIGVRKANEADIAEFQAQTQQK